MNKALDKRAASSLSRRRLRDPAKEARDAEIEQRYLTGETGMAIAASLSLSSGTVYNILRKRGVQMRVRAGGGSLRSPKRKAHGAKIEKRYLAGESVRSPKRKAHGAKIEKRYLAGESVQAIAVSLGMGYVLVRSVLKERGVSIRPPGKRIRDNEVRDAEVEQRYRAGETMQEIGESHGITRERVRQILEKRGVLVGERRTRGTARMIQTKRARRDRKIAAHRQAIVELKRQGFTNHEVARRLHVQSYFVSRVLREAFSKEERWMLRYGNRSKRISEAQLLEQIREARRALGSTMRGWDYDAYAKARGWAGGLLTVYNRFGSWSRACELAGVPVQMRRYRHKRKDFINRKTCLDAVRYVRDVLGKIPTPTEYKRYTRTSTMLPSLTTVRKRCSGWRNIIRLLLMDAGPQESSRE